MATKRDMRREELSMRSLWTLLLVFTDRSAVIPYVDPPKDKTDTDITSTMSSTLPMAAVSLLVMTPTATAWLIRLRRCSLETSMTICDVRMRDDSR